MLTVGSATGCDGKCAGHKVHSGAVQPTARKTVESYTLLALRTDSVDQKMQASL